MAVTIINAVLSHLYILFLIVNTFPPNFVWLLWINKNHLSMNWWAHLFFLTYWELVVHSGGRGYIFKSRKSGVFMSKELSTQIKVVFMDSAFLSVGRKFKNLSEMAIIFKPHLFSGSLVISGDCSFALQAWHIISYFRISSAPLLQPFLLTFNWQ